MNQDEIVLQASRHAALSDPVRLQVVMYLRSRDASPAALGERFEVASNLMAYHVGVLTRTGLVGRIRSEADHRRAYLRLLPAGRDMVSKPHIDARRVIFVCTQNSARSQFAHVLWRRHSTIPSTSAGTRPVSNVHPLARSTAASKGFDMEGLRPRAVNPNELGQSLVITVCDHADAELAFDGGHLHWSIPDPAESGRSSDFEMAFDNIAERVRDLADITREYP